MKIMKKTLKIVGVLLIVICICIGYAFFIEPKTLKVEHYIIEKANSQTSLKVIQLSDIHASSNYNIEAIDKLVDKVNSLQADVIVFTGDLFDNYSQYLKKEEVENCLSRLEAKYSKIAIWGNRDYGGGAQRIYQDLMENAGFTLLTNETMTLTINNKKFDIGGVDDFLLGDPQMATVANQLNGDFNLLLVHEPDEVATLTNSPADLVLGGHSHGGQIRLPFVSGIRTELAHNYVKGFYTIDEETQLFVNTGIGTTRIHARFMVAPEIDVFEIKF